MSKANYELWYLDDIGNRLVYINDAGSFEYTKVLGDVGISLVSVPKRNQIYDNELVDRRIAIYRQPENGSLSLDFVSMARRFDTGTTIQGQSQRQITGADFNELLKRRIVASYAGSAETTMTGTVDDLMKEVVRDAFIDNVDYSGTPSLPRDIDSYGLSVQSDSSDGPTITKSFAWKSVLTVLQDLQAASKAAGTEVFFGIVPTSETAMEFRTWTAGRDRTTGGANPIVFSLEWGNLLSPRLVDDFSNEANYIYGGGQGKEDKRIIQIDSDENRMNQSRLNRREGFAFSSGKTDAAVLADAENELERKRPISKSTGEIISTPLTPYGGLSGWNLGDKVTVNYAGRQFDVLIRAIHVRVNADGSENIRSKIESV